MSDRCRNAWEAWREADAQARQSAQAARRAKHLAKNRWNEYEAIALEEMGQMTLFEEKET